MLTNEDIDKMSYNLSSEETKDILKTIKATGDVTEAYSTTWFRIFLREASVRGLEDADSMLYPLVKEVVLDGVTDPIERNRLTSFHRVAKHLVKKALHLANMGILSVSLFPQTNKSDVLRAWKQYHVRSSVDPVAELVKRFGVLSGDALVLESEGLDIQPFKDAMLAYIR
jgi:hypothetical protein